ncbi:MAG: TlpA disulfide reductase family protein [Ferruginibacter sp.]
MGQHPGKVGQHARNLQYNYSVSTIQLSTFKGKLILLDFWSTWCSSCIEAFPKMQQLQNEFGNRLQVLLVNTYNGDDIKKVKPFFEKYKVRTGAAITLPYSLQQASLANYFPHKFVPHYVWIDAAGKVIAITSQLEVTKENISAILDGKQVNMHTKNDDMNFDNQQPLFVDGNGGTGIPMIYRSILTGYVEGLGTSSGTSRTTERKISRFYMLNTSLWMLLKKAYPHISEYTSNMLVVQTNNPYLHLPDADNSLDLYKYGLCYELNTPPSTFGELADYIQADIARAFRIKVNEEDRRKTCFVLQYNAIATQTAKGNNHPVAGSTFDISTQPMAAFIKKLNRHPIAAKMPVINETGLDSAPILPKDYVTMSGEMLTTFLARAGFTLKEAERDIRVAVICEY